MLRQPGFLIVRQFDIMAFVAEILFDMAGLADPLDAELFGQLSVQRRPRLLMWKDNRAMAFGARPCFLVLGLRPFRFMTFKAR